MFKPRMIKIVTKKPNETFYMRFSFNKKTKTVIIRNIFIGKIKNNKTIDEEYDVKCIQRENIAETDMPIPIFSEK